MSDAGAPPPAAPALVHQLPFAATLPLKWTAEHSSSLFLSALLPVAIRKPTVVSFSSQSFQSPSPSQGQHQAVLSASSISAVSLPASSASSSSSHDWNRAAETCIGLIEALALSRQAIFDLFPPPPASLQDELEELGRITGAAEALEQSFISTSNNLNSRSRATTSAASATTATFTAGGMLARGNPSMENLLDLGIENDLAHIEADRCSGCCGLFRRGGSRAKSAPTSASPSPSHQQPIGQSTGSLSGSESALGVAQAGGSASAASFSPALDHLLRGKHEGVTPETMHARVAEYVSLLLGLVFDLRVAPVPPAFYIQPSAASRPASPSPSVTFSPLLRAVEFAWSCMLLPQEQYFSVNNAMFELASMIINEGLWCMQYAHRQEVLARGQKPASSRDAAPSPTPLSAASKSSSSKTGASSHSLSPSAQPTAAQSALVKAASAFDFVRLHLLPHLPVATHNQLSQYPELTTSVLLALRYQCIAEQAELAAAEFSEVAAFSSQPLAVIEKLFPLCLVAASQYQGAHDSLARVLATDERSLPLLSRWMAHIRTRLAYFTAKCYYLLSLSFATTERHGYAIKCADHALLLLDAIAPALPASSASDKGRKKGFLGRGKQSAAAPGDKLVGGILSQLDSEHDSSSVSVWKTVVEQLRREIEPHLTKCKRDNEFIYFQPLPMDLPSLDPPPLASLPASLVLSIPLYELPAPDERWGVSFVYNILIDGNRSYLPPDARRTSNSSKPRSGSNFFDRFTRSSSGSNSRKKSGSRANF